MRYKLLCSRISTLSGYSCQLLRSHFEGGFVLTKCEGVEHNANQKSRNRQNQRDTRISAHLSLAQVEKLSGIPADIIDRLEVGIKPVDLGHLHQLAKAYGKAVKITLI